MNGGNGIDNRRIDWDDWLDGREIDDDDGVGLEMKIGDGGVVMFPTESLSNLLHRVTQHSLAGGISQNALPTSASEGQSSPAFHLSPRDIRSLSSAAA